MKIHERQSTKFYSKQDNNSLFTLKEVLVSFPVRSLLTGVERVPRVSKATPPQNPSLKPIEKDGDPL